MRKALRVESLVLSAWLLLAGSAFGQGYIYMTDGATTNAVSKFKVIGTAVSSFTFTNIGGVRWGILTVNDTGGSGGGGTTNLFAGAGTTGLVFSVAADTNKYLRGDGTWQAVSTTESDPIWAAASNNTISIVLNGATNSVTIGAGGLFDLGNLAQPTGNVASADFAVYATSSGYATNSGYSATSATASNALQLGGIAAASYLTNGASLNVTNFSGVIQWSNLSDLIPTNLTISAGSVTYNTTNRTWSITLPTLAGDVTGAIGGNTVTAIRGRTVNSGEPSVGSLMQWSGTEWVYVASNAVGQASSITNLSYVCEGFAAFPMAGTDAYPAGANGIEGVAMVSTNSAVGWCYSAPERWTGTNWTIRGTMRFPASGASTVTVGVQVVSFASGSTAEPDWSTAATENLIFASSGSASNRVILGYQATSLFTNVQAGQDVYTRAKPVNTPAAASWLKRLEILNQ